MRRTGRLATIACLLATAALSPIASERDVARAVDPGLSKLDHLIFVVQENRSFDHYFGTFPGADGIPQNPDGSFAVCIPDPYRGSCSQPYHSDSLFQWGGPHNQRASRIDVDRGAMDGFINALPNRQGTCWVSPHPGCDKYLGPDGQADVMSFHDQREIPNYWFYAQQYVLQDHMFAPTDSWTLPSHLFLVSGWSAACSDPYDPMSCVSDVDLTSSRAVRWSPHSNGPVYAWTDITHLLTEAGVSWRYYVDHNSCLKEPCEKLNGGTGPMKNPLPGFTDVQQDGTVANVAFHPSYFHAASAGHLPKVSWVVPGNGYSEHPISGGSLADGQAFVTRVVNAAMSGPDWASTAVFLTWDDWGGFYDHVPPLRIDANGYGIRVPGILISSYARDGLIDSQTLSFDAYLKLIEDRFLGGQRLDPATMDRPDSRPTVREDVAGLGDLANEFDFTQIPRAPTCLDPIPVSGATPIPC